MIHVNIPTRCTRSLRLTFDVSRLESALCANSGSAAIDPNEISPRSPPRRCPLRSTRSNHPPARSLKIKHDVSLIALHPEKRFSTFAGFVEPGESFEECVSREVFEEAGVYCNDINYLRSQAWPFPASIMIAFEAITDHPENARPDGEEITEVRWLTRDEMKKAVASSDILLPPSISVARKMITAWYVGKEGYVVSDLTGGESWR